MDEGSVDSAEEGLFLTAVVAQKETHKTVALDPNKKKLIHTLNLSDIHPSQYDEHVSGPMKPGCYFYKWLLRGAGLTVSIPDTLIVEKNIVRLVYNDPQSGQIIKARPLGDSKKQKKKFIRDVLGRFLDYAPKNDEDRHAPSRSGAVLARQVVAVLKKPFWRSAVGNDVEVLLPLPLVAQVMDAVDGKEGPFVIQKFIRYRGRRPCVYRCFWRAANTSSPRTVTVWNISSVEPAADFQGAFEPGLGARAKSQRDGQDNRDLALLDGIGKEVTDNVAFRAEVDSFVDNTSPLDRSALVRAGLGAHRIMGRSHLCCLTETDGTVTDASCNRVIVTKVIGRVAEELDTSMDKIALWMESAVGHKENLSLQLSDLVVDFIRDDCDRWHMLQVKGFRVTPATHVNIQRWISLREDGLDGDLALPVGLDFPKEDVKLNQHKEMRQDLEERRGIECKLCSQCFVEGQTLRVTDRNGRGRPDLGISNSLAGEQILAENGDKEVPAFGYQVSMQMACKLVEIYRDAKFPLSLIAKDILLDYGSVVDLPKDNGPRGASLDDAEPNRPGGSEPMVSGGVGLKKKRTGWMLVCYHCFTILEEHHYYQHTSDKLYKAFGIDSVNSNSAMSGDHGKAAGASQRPRSANKARRSASDSALPTAPSRAVLNKPNGDFSTQCMRYGHPEPWTRSALERDCGQYRLAVMAHYIMDARVATNNSAYGVDCCLTYSLGNASVSIPYKNTLEEEDFEEKLIWIKQCRLHYLFSTRRHAHELFQEKEIEFHLFVTRREDVYATKSIQRSSSSGQLGAKQAPPSGLQWESTFSVSLHQLRWLNCATADAGLLDKVDLLVPISTNSMGSMVLKLSIALEFTDFVPLQASSCNYLREKGVFWPPAGYNDGSPLPAAWLALMTPSRRVNDFNQRKDTSATHFNDHITTSPSQRTKQGVLPPPVSSGQRGHRLTIGLETAEASASATDRYLKRHMSNRSINSDRLQEGSSELGSETTSIDADKFDRISSLIPFVSRVFDRQRVVDINGGVRTTTVVNAVSDALSAGIVDTSLLTIDGKPFIQHVGSDLVDAIESLQAAIREMITDDRLPICITWEVFVEKVASYVGVILKKEARERLVKDAHSKLNIAGPMGSNGEEGRSGGILSTTRAIRVSKVLMDISQRLRGTALDVLPGENNIHRYNPADIDMSNLLLLPISRERKYRRLMFVMSMFEDISKRGEMVDAAELKQYLINERSSLIHALTLMRAGVMPLPSIIANFVPELSEPFSLSRAVICCHLLASSDKLSQLFARYETHGVAIISQIGFLKTVEECFNTITRNRGVIDKPLLDIKALADHFHKIKYVNVANSKPSSGPVQSVGWDPSYSDTEDSMSLKKLGLISSPFAAEGRAEADRKHKITLHEAGHFVKSVIHSVGVEKFVQTTSSPPVIQLTCDVHGDELFFLADLCCTLCERDNHRASASAPPRTGR